MFLIDIGLGISTSCERLSNQSKISLSSSSMLGNVSSSIIILSFGISVALKLIGCPLRLFLVLRFLPKTIGIRGNREKQTAKTLVLPSMYFNVRSNLSKNSLHRRTH
uniref:Uncharacterized protein n=1 Tax=Eucampia antarctica TaxID=49252 RepID=A0A7S2RAN2_9STRA